MSLTVFGTEIPTNMDSLEVFGKDMDELEVFGVTVWKKQKYYYIAFSSNGGSGEMEQQTMPCGTAAALPANLFTRIGYLFQGWNPDPKGDAIYSEKQEVTDAAGAGETKILHAIWKAITWYVKFNANGGSGTMANQDFKYDTAEALTANAFSRQGYSFLGWGTSPAGDVVYKDKQSVKNLKSAHGAVLNLYALWKIHTLEVYKRAYTWNQGVYITPGTVSVNNTTYVDKATYATLTARNVGDNLSSNPIILTLTPKAASEFKYAKVTVVARAYANYGTTTASFNNVEIAEQTNENITKTVTIPLSSDTLSYAGYLHAENWSSEPTWFGYAAIGIASVVLTNNP